MPRYVVRQTITRSVVVDAESHEEAEAETLARADSGVAWWEQSTQDWETEEQ